MTVELNQLVPDFEFQTTSSLRNRLSDHKGQFVVLYFYPKDNTPGCTQESKDFTQLHAQFKEHNTTVFGISRDTLASHEKFKTKFDMPFELISDADEKICHLFDVIKEKNLYGKKFMGIERSTFVINPEGLLVQAWRKVKVSGHAQAVLDWIKDKR